MEAWLEAAAAWNAVTVALVLVFAGSVLQGLRRGASGSARQLAGFVVEGAITVVAIMLAWNAVQWLGDIVRTWLAARTIVIPQGPLDPLKQLYYTLLTGVRDFPLLRHGILFLLLYPLVKQLLYVMTDWALRRRDAVPAARRSGGAAASAVSGALGAGIGSILGTARALLVIAALFVYTVWFPNAPFAGYIQASGLYKQGATQIIEPITGNFVERLPVFTRAVEGELAKILERRYEIIDAGIPDGIAEAAQAVTANAQTDEDKAKRLYEWVGSRIRYDWEKVRLYEEQGVWKEQTPEDTFDTRLGVCIDYSRLYAVMARSVGLDVKVVTGLGYDGRGSYGPHAWNEVYLTESESWVPLDATWVSSGGNWFNPPDFEQTHIRGAV